METPTGNGPDLDSRGLTLGWSRYNCSVDYAWEAVKNTGYRMSALNTIF